MTKKHVIIVGAGYGGIALANLLGRAGYKVSVYEKNSTVGGRIAAIRQEGFTFDLGPSWYLMPEVFEQYYALFGASAHDELDLIRFSPGYKVYFEHDDPVTIMGSVDEDAHTFEAIEKGAGKKLHRYVRTSTMIYSASTQRFLYDNFNNLLRFLRPDVLRMAPLMLRMVMRPLDAYVSKYFTDPRLKKILEYHMVFLGSSPFQAPALYTLMSHLDFRSGVYYPRRGMMSLPENLVKLGQEYDITYHTDSPVVRIDVQDGKAAGVEMADGTTCHADIVVSNADLHFTETQLLAPEYQSMPESYWKKRQSGPSALLISLGIKGELPQLLHHSLFFVDDWKENFTSIYETKHIPASASMYICNPTKTDPLLAPDGHENIFLLVPLPAGVNLGDDEHASLADRMIDTFANVIGEPELRARIVTRHVFGPQEFAKTYNAWEYNAFGGESHLLRQSAIFRTPNKSKKVKNLYYVGAGTMPGIGLPMCLIGAQLVYERIAGIRTGGPLSVGDDKGSV